MKPSYLIGIVIVAVAIGVTSYQLVIQNQPKPLATKIATVLNPPRLMAESLLVQHDGTPFSNATMRDKWTLMFFGFSYCPDICPTTMQSLMNSVNKVEQAGIENVQVVFVSVDPERDTPERLREYLSHFDEDFIGVTGQLADIEEFTRSIGVVFAHHSPDETGYYAVDHSAVILVINEKGEMRGLFSAPYNWEDIADDLIKIHG
jgi:protein SCO1/2